MKRYLIGILTFVLAALFFSGCTRIWVGGLRDKGDDPIYFDLKQERHQEIKKLIVTFSTDTGYYISGPEKKALQKIISSAKIMKLPESTLDQWMIQARQAHSEMAHIQDSIEKSLHPEWFTGTDTLPVHKSPPGWDAFPWPVELYPTYFVRKHIVSNRSDTLLFPVNYGGVLGVMLCNDKAYLVERNVFWKIIKWSDEVSVKKQ